MAAKPKRDAILPIAVVDALWQGNVIKAITLVRQERKISLNEAKDLVDTYITAQPALKKKLDQVIATARQRFIRWSIGFLVLAAGVGYFMMG